VEDRPVRQQPHPIAGSLVRRGEEALAGGIDLARFDPAAVQPLIEPVAVRRHADPAMDDQLQLRKMRRQAAAEGGA
jgi:hypothetical protein